MFICCLPAKHFPRPHVKGRFPVKISRFFLLQSRLEFRSSTPPDDVGSSSLILVELVALHQRWLLLRDFFWGEGWGTRSGRGLFSISQKNTISFREINSTKFSQPGTHPAVFPRSTATQQQMTQSSLQLPGARPPNKCHGCYVVVIQKYKKFDSI